jgi:glycosyltransferase involved in cell wall biosynthesis
MRIAYFSGTMRIGHDGVTRVLYRLADTLNARGIPAMFFSPIVPSAEQQPVPMRRVPSLQFPLYRDYRLALPGYRHFEEDLKAFNPDIIHINSPCSLGHAAARFGDRHGIPVVATYHTHFPSYAKYYRVKSLEHLGWNYIRNLYNSYCQRVYVPSEPILAELRDQYLRNLRYLPHGVDSVAFHPGFRSTLWRERLGIRQKTVALYAGRLVWEKDLLTLANAHRLLQGRRTDVAFVLAGDGPIRPELEQLMPGAVFLGHQSGMELSTSFASSDILAFPSTTETFGNVVLEAMASGVVPICAAEGGASGVISDHHTGLVTRPRDAEHLARSIEYLADQPGKRAGMADRALLYARRQSWDRIFDNLFADYDEITATFARRQLHERNKAA